jgi:hypothetical protein
MASQADGPQRSDSFLDDINTRLTWAERTGAAIEVVVAVRGRLFAVPGKRGERWRLRTPRGHVVTFRPEHVIAFKGTTASNGSASTSGRWIAPVESD